MDEASVPSCSLQWKHTLNQLQAATTGAQESAQALNEPSDQNSQKVRARMCVVQRPRFHAPGAQLQQLAATCHSAINEVNNQTETTIVQLGFISFFGIHSFVEDRNKIFDINLFIRLDFSVSTRYKIYRIC